jgi:hypothetical protein
MLNYIKDEVIRNGDKTKHRIVEYLVFIYLQNKMVIPVVGISIASKVSEETKLRSKN